MKKILYMILSALLLFILTACSSDDKEAIITDSEDKEKAIMSMRVSNDEEAIITDSEVNEAPAKEQEEPILCEWKEKYIQYIETLEYADHYDFYLIYLDDNDVPELFLSADTASGGEIVATYYNGAVETCQLSRSGTRYIERSGLLYTDTGLMGYYPVYITEMKNGAFTQLAEGISKEVTGNGELLGYSYEWEGAEVTEEEFQEHVAEFFDVDKGIRPENEYSKEEMLSLLTTGYWTSYGHSYELIIQNCTWNEAQEICKSNGGYLATITSVDEAQTIARQIADEGKTGDVFYVGYRESEWVSDDEFCRSRWINADGSYIPTFLASYLSDYNAPDYTGDEEWEYDDQDCGIIKYYDETESIYVFPGPDELLEVSPQYSGVMGFVCEYDN